MFNPTPKQEIEYKLRKERVKKFYASPRLKGVAMHISEQDIEVMPDAI